MIAILALIDTQEKLSGNLVGLYITFTQVEWHVKAEYFRIEHIANPRANYKQMMSNGTQSSNLHMVMSFPQTLACFLLL